MVAVEPGDRSFTYIKLGRLVEAIADYSKAIETAGKQQWTKRPQALFGRGVARRKTGDTAGGDGDIATAKAIRPEIADDFAKWGVKEF